MKYCLHYLTGRLAWMALLVWLWPVLSSNTNHQENWVKLGDRTVNHTVDHSEMIVDRMEQQLNAVKVKVKIGAINLHRCVVHYKNGQIEDVTVLNSIPEGEESKLIEVPDKGQPVIKLVFTYDTKNRAIQKAVVELWGRQH